MGEKITDSDRAEAPQVQPGQRVCIVGQGADNLIHRHETVARVTATQIVTTSKTKHGEHENRYTRNWQARSIPYSPWGGSRLYATCQRPKPKTEG